MISAFMPVKSGHPHPPVVVPIWLIPLSCRALAKSGTRSGCPHCKASSPVMVSEWSFNSVKKSTYISDNRIGDQQNTTWIGDQQNTYTK